MMLPRGTGMEPVVVHCRVVGENSSHVAVGAKGPSPMPLTANAVPSWSVTRPAPARGTASEPGWIQL